MKSNTWQDETAIVLARNALAAQRIKAPTDPRACRNQSRANRHATTGEPVLHHCASASVKPEEPGLDEVRPQRKDFVSFGRFHLFATQRLLETGGVPLNLGSRALDLLIERATKVVGKGELMARVRPDLVVEKSTLGFHIACLRNALGHGQLGVRYVTNVAGRGYCFVAPIMRSAATPSRAENLVADHSMTLCSYSVRSRRRRGSHLRPPPDSPRLER
jgi:DNA-binding winged helix-turn-helix (wHTH) protein